MTQTYRSDRRYGWRLVCFRPTLELYAQPPRETSVRNRLYSTERCGGVFRRGLMEIAAARSSAKRFFEPFEVVRPCSEFAAQLFDNLAQLRQLLAQRSRFPLQVTHCG